MGRISEWSCAPVLTTLLSSDEVARMNTGLIKTLFAAGALILALASLIGLGGAVPLLTVAVILLAIAVLL